LFDIDRGRSRYTKKYGNANKGDYPVYSASNNAPLTLINTFDFNGKYLTWATNGFAGYIMLIDGKFSINADRGLLRPKQENINIQYIKSALEPKLRELAKGRKGEKGEDEFTKVYPSMVENVEIDMFVDEDGNFDVEKQNEVAEKHEYIAELRERIENYKKQIGELNVEIGMEFVCSEINLAMLMNLQDGFAFPSSIYTTNKNAIKLIRIQDVNEKSEPKEVRIPQDYALINKERYLVRKGDFLLSLSGAAGFNLKKWYGEEGYLNQRITKIELKDEYKYKLIEDYEEILFSIIYKELNSKGFGANNNLSKKDLLNINFKIPINPKGEFDLSAQKDIAEKYRKIEQIKKSISEELDKIANIEIDFE